MSKRGRVIDTHRPCLNLSYSVIAVIHTQKPRSRASSSPTAATQATCLGYEVGFILYPHDRGEFAYDLYERVPRDCIRESRYPWIQVGPTPRPYLTGAGTLFQVIPLGVPRTLPLPGIPELPLIETRWT